MRYTTEEILTPPSPTITTIYLKISRNKREQKWISLVLFALTCVKTKLPQQFVCFVPLATNP